MDSFSGRVSDAHLLGCLPARRSAGSLYTLSSAYPSSIHGGLPARHAASLAITSFHPSLSILKTLRLRPPNCSNKQSTAGYIVTTSRIGTIKRCAARLLAILLLLLPPAWHCLHRATSTTYGVASWHSRRAAIREEHSKDQVHNLRLSRVFFPTTTFPGNH